MDRGWREMTRKTRKGFSRLSRYFAPFAVRDAASHTKSGDQVWCRPTTLRLSMWAVHHCATECTMYWPRLVSGEVDVSELEVGVEELWTANDAK